MINNIWNIISFYCNCHDTPIRMIDTKGPTSTFFSCPKYKLKDEDHPDGHEKGERSCANRLNYGDALELVTKLSNDIQESLFSGEYCDFTNHQLHHKQIDAKIITYNDDQIEIGIINKKALK